MYEKEEKTIKPPVVKRLEMTDEQASTTSDINPAGLTFHNDDARSNHNLTAPFEAQKP